MSSPVPTRHRRIRTAHRILAGVAATTLMALYPAAAQAAEDSDPPVLAPPTISAGGPYEGVVGEPVNITGSLPEIVIPVEVEVAVAAVEVEEVLTVWEYDGEGEGECTFGDVNALATTVTCDTAGEYTLTLTASPHLESSLSATTSLTINDKEDEEPPANTPPTNDAGGPYSGIEGEPIAVEGSASDVDGDELTHTWHAYGPGNCAFDDPNSLSTTVSCDTHGYYKLVLETTDGAEKAWDKAYLKIECEPEPVPTTPTPTPTTPTEEPTPSTSTSTTPSLPVTGSSLTSVLTSGVVLVGLGIAALLFGRVRRTRTES